MIHGLGWRIVGASPSHAPPFAPVLCAFERHSARGSTTCRRGPPHFVAGAPGLGCHQRSSVVLERCPQATTRVRRHARSCCRLKTPRASSLSSVPPPAREVQLSPGSAAKLKRQEKAATERSPRPRSASATPPSTSQSSRLACCTAALLNSAGGLILRVTSPLRPCTPRPPLARLGLDMASSDLAPVARGASSFLAVGKLTLERSCQSCFVCSVGVGRKLSAF